MREEASCLTDYFDAHRHSINHRDHLLRDRVCGCFFCLAIFSTADITEWIADTSGTAVCPFCGVDAVIGESSGYPITPAFLEEMQKRWF